MTKEEIAVLSQEEVEARQSEISQMIEADDGSLDLSPLVVEADALMKRSKELREAEAEKRESREKVAGGAGELIKKIEEDKPMEERTFAIDTVEYREAFLKKLQGKELTAEERTAVTATAAIPTKTMNEIVHKLELNPLISAVDLTQIPGYVSYPAEDSIADASWVAMGTASTDSEDSLKAVNLAAYKLIKTVEINADVDAMSIDAFETWLVERLANKIEKALDAGILNGGGADSSMCLGIVKSKSTQDGTFTRAGITWKQLTSIIGALPGQYHPNASFVMSPTLFFTHVLGMLDSQNNRVVVMDPQEPRKYNILGFPCIVDGNAATTDILFGDLKAYKMNLAKPIEVKSSEDAEFRKGSRVWRAMTLADGKLADTNAIVRYIATT